MNTEHDKINTYIATRTLEDGTVEYALGVRKKGLFYRWKGKRVEDIWPVWSADGIYRVMPIRPGNCSNRGRFYYFSSSQPIQEAIDNYWEGVKVREDNRKKQEMQKKSKWQFDKYP